MRIVIRTDNDAFAGCDAAHEVARLLLEVAARLHGPGYQPGVRYPLRDRNGNTVGWVDGIPAPV